MPYRAPATPTQQARQQAQQQAHDALRTLPGWPATLEQTMRQHLPAAIVRLVAIFLAPKPTPPARFDAKAAASGDLVEQ